MRDPTVPAPWTGSTGIAPAFVVPWATGPDPELDGVFRLLAMRPGEEGWSTFEAWCDPFPDQEDESATARMAREFGVTGAELQDAHRAGRGWEELEEFLADAPVIAPVGESFEAWAAALGGRRRTVIGLDELAALWLPGRLASRREGLVRALSGAREGPPAAVHPTELALAVAELVRRVLELDPATLRVACIGYARATHGLAAVDEQAAARLGLALALVDRPSDWARSAGELFHPGEGLEDGCLLALHDGDAPPETLLDGLQPTAAAVFGDWGGAEKLPPTPGGPAPFEAADRALLDEIFEHHLPALLAEELGGEAADYLRPTQQEVAREVASVLGTDELLLVHAPTGTGKTLAYLLPAMLWARRHDVRIGIATYTRALQEQAMDGEVPRALALLARAGVAESTRVSVLKGRENYVCFRALRSLAPELDDEAEAWLAWTQLALFALTDLESDLDRLPRQSPVRLASSTRYRARLTAAARNTRARTGCCTRVEDRAVCAADLARHRAERSHVVLTNHSFALARQEFFRHLILDECEHLHDGAAAAFSHAISLRHAREVLGRLHDPARGARRAPLDRLAHRLAPKTAAAEAVEWAVASWENAVGGLERLERAVEDFEDWRSRTARGGSEEEEYALLRAYVESPDGEPLVLARHDAEAALNRLEGGLAWVLEATVRLPLRGAARRRRALELARGDLVELGEALSSWLPLEEGRPALRREIFYDVARDGRGELELLARVLLPNELLGRSYYPDLGSACLLSATTRLAGSFDAALGYLGLDRAAEPAEDEEREGRTVRTFGTPEVFDYGRVLVGVPRDAPLPSSKDAYLTYVARLIDWLGERTRGRILALFTNLADVRRVGTQLAPIFRERRIPLWYQGMDGAGKEELSALFRSRVDSVLLGVDTFWFGADFPGETLEYLILARLPFGVPDRYHHAQCAVLGTREQRRRIYLPRALAKFRQGFGRLMRRHSDRGCVLVLDRRVLEPRHRAFLRELPLAVGSEEGGARLARGDSTHVLREALAHMGMLADLRRRGLGEHFADPPPRPEPPLSEPPIDVPLEDLPF